MITIVKAQDGVGYRAFLTVNEDVNEYGTTRAEAVYNLIVALKLIGTTV